jgi:hypothetical protein
MQKLGKPGSGKKLQVLYDHSYPWSIKSKIDAGFHWELGVEDICGYTHTAHEAVEALWASGLSHAAATSEKIRISLMKALYDND